MCFGFFPIISLQFSSKLVFHIFLTYMGCSGLLPRPSLDLKLIPCYVISRHTQLASSPLCCFLSQQLNSHHLQSFLCPNNVHSEVNWTSDIVRFNFDHAIYSSSTSSLLLFPVLQDTLYLSICRLFCSLFVNTVCKKYIWMATQVTNNT